MRHLCIALAYFSLTGSALLCPVRAVAQTWRTTLDSAEEQLEARHYDSALIIGYHALEQATATGHAGDSAAAHVLFRLAWYFDRLGIPDSAISRLEQAIPIMEEAVGPTALELSRYVNGLGIYYTKRGDLAAAIDQWGRALAIRERHLGPDHAQVAQVLNNLGIAFRRQSRYDTAQAVLERALVIRLEQLGPDHRHVASTYNNLGSLSSETGHYREAEFHFREALRIKEKTLKPNNPSTANSVNGLAIAVAKQGRFAEAEPLYARAIAMFEQSLGPQHPALTNPLNNLAILYFNMGRFEEAEALDRRTLEIRIAALGPENADVAVSMTNLAHRLTTQRRYEEALPLYEEALRIRRTTLGPDHPHVAKSLQLIGEWYAAQQDFSNAIGFFQEALAIHDRAALVDPMVHAYVLGLVADARSHLGEFDRADEAFAQAHERMAGRSETSLYRTVDVFQYESVHRRRTGQLTLALAAAHRALQIRQLGFAANAMVLSERDALTYAHLVRTAADYYLSALHDAAELTGDVLRQAGEVIISTKGQVSDLVFARYRSLVEEDDPAIQALGDRLQTVRYQISRQFVATTGGADSQHRMDSLGLLAHDLESELASRSATFRDHPSRWHVDLDDVVSSTPANSSLIEFVRYDYIPTEGPWRRQYLALVLPAAGEMRLAQLGEATELDDLIEQYRAHLLDVSSRPDQIQADDQDHYDKLASALYHAIWKPCRLSPTASGMVFIAPDGGLNLVSFAGLQTADGQYLVERFPIHYLSAARDIVRYGEPSDHGMGLWALGDPDFDCLPETRVSGLEAPGRTESSAAEMLAVRYVRSDCEGLVSSAVPRLPGTRVELERAGEAWSATQEERVSLRFGTDASEDRFKREAPSYRVVHLATHGYYLHGACDPGGGSMSTEFIGEHPLLLAGLYMAGANLHGAGAAEYDAEDGILTAEEVAGMDFSQTSTVVLSACETGLGKVEQGEGVYGLRRAFQLSGARTVVSALWRVSDSKTAQFMTRLYEFDAPTYPELLRNTALDQIRSLRNRGRSDHPYYWAAFTATGDWRIRDFPKD